MFHIGGDSVIKATWFLLLAAFSTLLSGCIFFAASSEFYIANQSDYSIRAEWETIDGSSSSLALSAGERQKLGERTMIETNKVLPSDVYSKIDIYVLEKTLWALKYSQSPINNDKWSERQKDGSADYIFDLIISNSDIGM